MPLASLLIVDDEKNILKSLSMALRIEDYAVDVAESGIAALELLSTRTYDAILLDVMMPKMDGITALKLMRERGHLAPVIVMSGHATIDTAVEATRLGAHDFIEKPIATERLLLSLSRALKLQELSEENRALKAQTGALDELVGKSAPMQNLRKQLELAAPANASILVLGERGTGKELVARAVHKASKRAERPLEKLNCAAVPRELIESELFGHEAGAFTGATKRRLGKFERASGGTLFLDEVGDMPADMQAKLLRVLQEGELERVGGNKVIKVDVRVVAATNKPLLEEIEAGRFRADLYDRLNVLPLRVPPLRERNEDIEELATVFLAQACRNNDRPLKKLSPGTLNLLRSYSYPGNVRELRNLIERLVILTPSTTITESEAKALLPISEASGSGGGYYRPATPLKQMMEEVERDLINRSLQHHSNHITKTAADLSLERSHLYKKMKALEIKRD